MSTTFAFVFQFYAMLEKSRATNLTLELKQATIFAPTNEAFQKLEKPRIDDETLIAYHMSKYQLQISVHCLTIPLPFCALSCRAVT